MPFSIELFFDDKTSEAVRNAWHVLKDVCGSDYMIQNGVYPHVSLSVFEAEDAAQAQRVFARCAKNIIPFHLTPSGIDCFLGEKVVFMGFDLDAALVAAHDEITRALNDENLVSNPYYRRHAWRPHCTLAMQIDPNHAEKTVATAAVLSWDWPYQAEAMALVSFPPTRLLLSTSGKK